MTLDLKRATTLGLTLALALVLWAPVRAEGGAPKNGERPPRYSSLGMNAAAADDDIPGVTLPRGVYSDELDEFTDTDDVYAINLVEGQELEVHISSDAGSDFDLELFGPGSSSVFVDASLAGGHSAGSYDNLFYTVPATGVYYIDVWAFSGGGAYTIQIVEAIPPVVTFEPQANYVGSASILITASDTGGSGVNFIVYWLDDVGSNHMFASSTTVVTNQRGAHKLAAITADCSNNYSTTVTRYFNVVDATALNLARLSTTTPIYGTGVRLRATLTRDGALANQREMVAGQTLVLERQSAAGWVGEGTAATDAVGEAAMTVQPYHGEKTIYRVSFPGTSTYGTSASATLTVTPKVSLTKPNAPTTMYKAKTAAVSGYLKPRHAAGSYPVKIYKYRYVSGKWRSYGFVKAKASNYSTYTKYSKSLSLPYRGKWRLRAYAPADSKHTATWSTFDYVTVK